uniref:Uncharacterized protein n=1 Tax=Arundo donax TaxID=35708 RepID=A0A0A8XWH6_ARUDO
MNNLQMANGNWVVDSGASAHVTLDDGILQQPFSSPPCSVIVGNGHSVPVSRSGHTHLHTPTGHTFHLCNVLHVPSLVHNLLSVRKFTRDNSCSIEFDPLGFSVKDLQTKAVISCCNSGGDLYTFPAAAFVSSVASSDVWHRRLGHPGRNITALLRQTSSIPIRFSDRLCHACQIGKSVRLPFSSSSSVTRAPFDLIHCDVWTSPVLSMSGYQYYLVIIDDFSHFYWTFPLRLKSDVFTELESFFSYVRTQSGSLSMPYRQTMAGSLSTPLPKLSLLDMVCCFAAPVRIPPLKMARLNVLSTLLMTLCTPFCFKHSYLLASGLKHLLHPHTFLIAGHAKLLSPQLLTSPSTVYIPAMLTFEFLALSAIPI